MFIEISIQDKGIVLFNTNHIQMIDEGYSERALIYVQGRTDPFLSNEQFDDVFEKINEHRLIIGAE